MQAPTGEGGSVYLRLSTRSLTQPKREMTPELKEGIINGGYYFDGFHPDRDTTKTVIISCGAVTPEAQAAVQASSERRRRRRRAQRWP